MKPAVSMTHTVAQPPAFAERSFTAYHSPMSYDCTPILYGSTQLPFAPHHAHHSFGLRLPNCPHTVMPVCLCTMLPWSSFPYKSPRQQPSRFFPPIIFAVYLNFPLSDLPLPSATACWHRAPVRSSNISTAPVQAQSPNKKSKPPQRPDIWYAIGHGGKLKKGRCEEYIALDSSYPLTPIQLKS
jgi:hypothetical protein